MMDILVTFPDGTTELRAANSPAGSDVYGWPPAATYDRGWCIGGDLYPELVDWRGDPDAHVWRVTGQDAATNALTGEWQSAQIETVDEQIARLTRERDAAEKRIADLRAWAERAETASLDGIHAASGQAARERYRARRGAFASVVAKIDGKAG